MGIMTRPNEISPLHMARMMTQYPFCLVSRLLRSPGVRTVKTWQSKRSCHNGWARDAVLRRIAGEYGVGSGPARHPKGITDERERTGTASARSRGTAARGDGGSRRTYGDRSSERSL